MARPVYVICAHGVAVDKERGFFSVFEVVEKVIGYPKPEPKPDQKLVVFPYRPLSIASCWMSEPEKGDSGGAEFEHEFEIRMPGGEPISTPPQKVTFAPGEAPTFHRLIATVNWPLPIMSAGTALIISRIRRVGSDEWVSQDYPFLVETVDSLPPQPDEQNA